MASQERTAAERLRSYPGKGLSAVGGSARWVWDFSRRRPLGGVGLFLVAAVVFVAIFGGYLAPEDPLEIHARNLFANPGSGGFILGTDHLGRDQLSRILVGARTSIEIAVISVLVGSAIGFLMGLYSGFYADWRDSGIQRLVDMQMSIPTLVLALAVVAALGASKQNVIIAIGFTQIAGTARVVRSVALSVRTAEFVQAARALGATDTRILVKHIVPQTFAPTMILVTSALGVAIIIESSLSFLGLGTPPPNPAWGAMLAGPTLQNVERAPWNVVFPGLALSLTVFGFNLLGDALRDHLDPRLRT